MFLSRREFLELAGAWGISWSLDQLGISQAAPLEAAHFFPETQFWVKDDGGINFYSGFYRLGGVPTLGYPISSPFEKEEFFYQAFQRGILQVSPQKNQAVLANIMDWLAYEGKDGWLYQKGIPRHFSGDDGSRENWGKAKEIRLGWLTDPAIKTAFFKNPDPIGFFGLPTSKPERFGPFTSQRFQRYVFQKWEEEVAGMPPKGSVVGVLIGDLAKEAGLIPKETLKKEEPLAKKEISLPPIIYRGDQTKPFVSLTIDDAWFPSLVTQALGIARRLGVKMTFFPVGRVILGQADLWRQAVAEGHEIGNHTFSHKKLTDLSSEEVIGEIQAAEKALNSALGFSYQMRLLRPPGGAGGYRGGDPRILRIAQSLGYSLTMWSVDPLKAASTFVHVSSQVKNGDIILLHFNAKDINDLEPMIKNLKAKGLVLTTISGLFEN